MVETARTSQSDALQRYSDLVIDIMEQRQLGITALARAVGVDRSHLCKVRRRERPMSPRLLDDLIGALELDRARMALAVSVLGRRDLYGTPAFANVCAFTDTILNSLLHFLEEPSRFDRASVFAALPAASCEILAEQSLSHVQAQFTKLESSLLTRNDERRAS